MKIINDFSNYIDGNNLNSPAPGVWTKGQSGSDNGTLFTSEMYVMINKNNEITEQDKLDYAQKIGQCIDSNGLLNRVPLGEAQSLESVDNYYGVTNGCIELSNTEIPRKFLWAVIKYKGALNNISPGTWSWQSFLIRQPQLLAAIVSAAFPSLKNPFHYLCRILAFPWFLAAAISLLISCINTPTNQTDPRRLGWHLQNNVKKTSLLCWLASKVWLWRLNKDYSNGMKDVAAIYYNPNGLNNNPYSKYWVN